MDFGSIIERQKNRDWTSARTCWEAADAHILRDLNLAICHTWLGDYAEALSVLDGYKPWSDSLGGLAGLSRDSLAMLRRSLLAVELLASDVVGESTRDIRCAEELAALGGDLHELVRIPLAVMLVGGQIEILEEVDHLGDLSIPLTLHANRLRVHPSAEARRLASLYQLLDRRAFEPLTTKREKLETAIGLAIHEGPRIFTPAEWRVGPDNLRTNARDSVADNRQTPPSSPVAARLEDFWPGFGDQLGRAFRGLVEAVSKPSRPESVAEYVRVYLLVKEFASHLPLCRTTIEAGTSLYRARVCTDATCEAQVSYVPDPMLVREFGRANAPEESMFYCSSDPRTAVAEVLNTWFDTAQSGDTRRVVVGRWVATTDIEVALVPYHDQALELSPVRRQVHAYFEHLRVNYAPATYALIRDCFTFLGTEYARPARCAMDYWVSTAFFNFATNPRNFTEFSKQVPLGLCYPSVQMQYHGDNIATFPNVVDSTLHMVDAQAMLFRHLRGQQFTLEGGAPRWFAKIGRRFEF